MSKRHPLDEAMEIVHKFIDDERVKPHPDLLELQAATILLGDLKKIREHFDSFMRMAPKKTRMGRGATAAQRKKQRAFDLECLERVEFLRNENDSMTLETAYHQVGSELEDAKHPEGYSLEGIKVACARAKRWRKRAIKS